MLSNAYIPYGGYYSTPFARWQGSMANENSIALAADTSKRWLEEKAWDPGIFDYLYLGITISQIHTHKIRGADIVLIAQDDEELRKAVEGKPAEVDDYYCRYIKVPKMFDETMFVYQAAVVLQLLALKMSVDKMKFLNKHHVANHGVHPDVPKNVSKSITVD